MAKFSRVVQLKDGYHTISHEGATYREEIENSGIFEAKNEHADHFVEAGFVNEYASDLNEAEKKWKAAQAEQREAAKAAPVKKL